MLNSLGFSAQVREVALRGLVRSTLFIIAISVSLAATAQQTQRLRDRDPDVAGAKKIAGDLQQANFHWRSFYLLSRFRIADAGYSETSYLPASGSGGFNLALEAPHRLYYVPHRKTVFSAEVVPGYTIIGDDEELGNNNFSYTVRGDAHFLLNHLYLDVYTLRADAIRAHVADVNELARTREDETGVAGEWKYSSRTSATFAARYRDTEYPENRFGPGETPLALLDRSERNGRVSFNHKTFPLTSLFVSAEGSDYGFRFASFKDSKRRWIGAGAAYDNGRTQLRVEAGPGTLNFDDADQNDFSGFLGNISASRATGRWTLSARAERDIGFSIYQANNYFVADAFHTGAEYAATRRLSLRGNVAYEIDNYDTLLFGRDRRDTTSFTSLGFTYGLRRLRVGIDGGWYERDSTFAGDVDSGIRYVFHLSFTP